LKNKKVPYTHRNNVYRGRFSNRGATSIEAAYLPLPLFKYRKNPIPYPFNGGTRAFLLSSERLSQAHSMLSPVPVSTIPALCNILKTCTLLARRFAISIFKKNAKKGSSPKKDGKPVVPPLLAENSPLSPYQAISRIRAYNNGKAYRLSLLPLGFGQVLGSPFTQSSALIRTIHQLSLASARVTTLRLRFILFLILNRFILKVNRNN
jgi:hypothetical protein